MNTQTREMLLDVFIGGGNLQEVASNPALVEQIKEMIAEDGNDYGLTPAEIAEAIREAAAKEATERERNE